jgi:dihydrodipicolinate synthase/N-acetylneuraminate lyase
VAEVLPLFGFYLQTAVGGRVLDLDFWRGFLEIENVVAIKVAPFDRYRTLEVVRALAESGRADEVSLYTGNDDAIVADLLSDLECGGARVAFRGGLLGQWATGTRRAVELLEAVKHCRREESRGALGLLALGQRLTDMNAAFFDVRGSFAGCIAGIGEVLRRQGLVASRACLDPREDLSPGQAEEIARVVRAYPELTDDAFVAAHLDEWLR